MDNALRATELDGDGRKMGEGRVTIQALASNRCTSTEEGFGGTETPDRRGSTP